MISLIQLLVRLKLVMMHVNALLCIKTNIKSDCYKFSPTKSLLRASKNPIGSLKDRAEQSDSVVNE